MPMILIDKSGKEKFLSSEILKRELSSLKKQSNEKFSEINLESLNDSNLNKLFQKLNISIKKVTHIEMEEFMKKRMFERPDLISALLTFSKPHFISIFYLLYEGKMTVDELEGIVLNNYTTRNDIIMTKFSQEETNAFLFDKFIESLNSLFSMLKPNLSQLVSRLSSLSTIDSEVEIVPDQFYFVRSALRSGGFLGFFMTDHFSEVIWDNYDGKAIPNSSKEKGLNFEHWWFNYVRFEFVKEVANFLKLSPLLSAGAIIGAVALAIINPISYITLVAQFNPVTLVAFLFYKDYDSYFDYLEKNSPFRGVFRNIKTLPFSDLALNKYFGEVSRLSFRNRKLEPESDFPPATISDDFLETVGKFSISDVFSEQDKIKTRISFFNYIYWMYNDTSSFSSMSSMDFSDFNSNQSNNFRASASLSPEGLFNFNYVEDTEFKNFLLELFPENITQRSDFSYIRKYFINNISPNQSTNSNNFSSQSLIRSGSLNLNGLLNRIYDNDIIAQNNGKVISLGTIGKREYMDEAIKVAIKELNISNEIDLSNLTDFATASTYITSLKSNIIAKLKAQTDNSSSPSYNRYLSNKSNSLFKIFFVDLVEYYFDFLLDSSATSFNPSLSSNGIKFYRVLNFLKHSFNNIRQFSLKIKDSKSYRAFLLSIFFTKYQLSESEMKSVVDRNLPIANLEALYGRTN
jgi:hypothetical protein